MSKGSRIGILLMAGSVVGIILYGWLVLSFATLTLQVTVFVMVAAAFAALGWIGWSMVMVPPAPVRGSSPSPPTKQPTGVQANLIALEKDGSK